MHMNSLITLKKLRELHERIQPSNTISVCEEFILTSDSPVEEVTEYASYNDLKVTKTYEITE